MNKEKTEFVKNLISQNLDRSISLDFVAKKSHISVFHLARIFKAVEGISIKQYILSQKLEKSLQEVIYSNRKLIDISFKAGFEDYTSYSRNFKKRYKVSPDDLRKVIIMIKRHNNVPVNAIFCIRTGAASAGNLGLSRNENAFVAKKVVTGKKKEFIVHPYILP